MREAGRRGVAPVERDRVPHRIHWWAAGEHHLGRARLNLRLTEDLAEFDGPAERYAVMRRRHSTTPEDGTVTASSTPASARSKTAPSMGSTPMLR
jgi:hypothetical protein